ncbi:thymidine phosphorylase [Metamycoplasma hominis]|uniref:Thymidine phosphorylase n=1 Tax=Metamycoplasma hominis (strain ATCC 23114 / DSM 25592 / NBRC 14850 / NCTC 10111 / PG21) TaxID=347256 RepID=D1J8C2_METH1|nr:thymidine phosphorylase [Metamycoplasma hominis]MBD3899123.1 thymidine phosphorylase [Metamycoplasma hominis]OKL23489.1 pyrimidine-nucleoside phosphorylase [Metamycoplasma hominis]QKX36730.1 thymidine phosphorylase [Metamycoplasma hominis]QKX39518.1 thymidine phosphorylase [Metamycoplasma hominis]QKX40060.1 thymidine phosphorylase [Metamycoplasma hominis]
MRIIDIINKKVENQTLTKEEIDFFIKEYVAENVPDYQAAALLMAIRLNGLSDAETAQLTDAMMHSGEVLDWSYLNKVIVDKHSTGGVGDKVSIALCPILAALGLTVAKMSGRGLGHTGGTLDKLESIDGYNFSVTDQQFRDLVEKHGIAIVGQNQKLVPADKKIYALRDVTGTVQSIPLIASSIMSKKLATGSNCILLDVKCGNGAFMKDINEAKKLGKLMIEIGKKLNRKIAVEITNMQQPLGKTIGNKIEVLEAIDTLNGHGPKDFTEIIYSSGSTLLVLAQKAKDEVEARKMIDEVINNKKAYNKFLEWISAQGGNIKVFEKDSKWFNPQYKQEIIASQSGYLKIKSAIDFGLVAMKLGAGRSKKEDSIDYEAGIYLNKSSNEYVNKGDVLFTLYSSKPINPELQKELLSAIEFSESKHDIQTVFAKLM